jgi:hypothetical protein
MVRLGAFLAAGLLLSALPAHAKGTPAARDGQTRFPAVVSDKVLQDFLDVGRVKDETPRDAGEWFRWGGIPVEHQASSIRAVVDALAKARPPIGVAAAILTIARVESGWNPYSRNPTSTACGLFQFVRATWATYDPSQDRCFDPRANAAAGVKHLMALYQTRVGPRLEPLLPITTEDERVQWTYRLLYALHYHGEAAPEAAEGGTIFSQTVAEAGMAHLQGFFSILKRVTAPPVRVRTARAGTRRAPAGPKARRAAAKTRAAG